MAAPEVRVLLADDHAVVRAGIANAVAKVRGLRIVGEVGDGRALVESLAELRPDLLLIDVAMPRFDPLNDVRWIQTHYPGLKILVVSAYDDDIYVRGLLELGVHGYHLKDQPLDDLALAVERVLAGQRWLSGPLVDRLLSPSRTLPDSPCLTARQVELLRLLHRGLDNQSIAAETGLSIKTVENHLTRLYRQLNVGSRLEAASYAAQHPEVLAMPGRLAEVAAPRLAGQDDPAVLIVDDNLRYRQQLRRAIGKAAPQALVWEADDTAEALRLCQRVTFRLVLVDMILGEESGIACVRRIKAEAPGARVVLISAYPDREFRRQGLAAGAVAFLDKRDLDMAAIHQIMRDVLA